MSYSGCVDNKHYNTILDQSTATIVCLDCSQVVTGGLTHFEVNQQSYSVPQENLKNEEKEEEINGESVSQLLEKICDKLHLSKCSIDNAYLEYKKNTKKINKMLDYPSKKLFLSPLNILIFSIHTSLSKDLCPRSIKDVCDIAGVSEYKNIRKINSFLEKNKGDTHSTRLKPINAKNIILTHYLYIEDFSYEDVKQIDQKINALEENNFTPTTTAAGAVYLYSKNFKSKKLTMTQAASIFNVTTMSIQRFINKYKPYFL